MQCFDTVLMTMVLCDVHTSALHKAVDSVATIHNLRKRKTVAKMSYKAGAIMSS